MHRSPEAKAIAKALGVKRIKSDPSCVRCHYTPVEKRGKVRAGHGVSCESCHGAAHDWLVVHDDFGGKEVTRELETKEHRAERAQRCRERGMRRPEDIHSLASECFACHVVSDENLINKTDHPIGQQFELLSWMQGEVRHNFLLSNGTKNAEPAPARKRLLYVMGALLDLEYGLRAYAVATTDGRYRVTMAQRVETAIEKVMVIDGKLEKHPFTGFCATLRETALAERSAETLIFLADQAQRLAQGLQAGPSLPAALDTLLPATEAYRGKSLVGH